MALVTRPELQQKSEAANAAAIASALSAIASAVPAAVASGAFSASVNVALTANELQAVNYKLTDMGHLPLTGTTPAFTFSW